MKLEKKIQKISKILTQTHRYLGVAESCTGGRIGAALTSLPGASDFFFGSLVSYANQTKHDLLRVPQKLLKNPGAVSEPVVIKMAQGALKIFKCDWAIAVTGIAGPGGGTPFKPVGLVYYAVAGPKIEVVEKRVFKGSRNKIQQQTVEASLSLLLRLLTINK